MSRPIPAPVLFDALAALRAVKDSQFDQVPAHLWRPAMLACARLQQALEAAGLTVQVEQAQESSGG